MAVQKLEKKSKVSFAGRVLKADTRNLVVNDVLTYEDDFAGLYQSNNASGAILVEPPYNPATLTQLLTKNNVLAQCVQAMEVNIDGTGHTLEKVDSEAETDDEAEKERLEAFFDEPYPGVSFVTIRRDLRYDLEATGNAYLEVIRNLEGDVVFLRRLESTMMRLVKLDGPVVVEKEIDRGGEKVKASMYVRERRFCQRLGVKLLYFKEYGASRELNRDTGLWEENVPVEKRASEVIHFTLERDTATQYGIPRWINQMPSVLGSRKAEEFNLEFFDNGGVPPAVVFIQGGALLGDVRDQLLGYFGGKATHRVAVCEIQSTSGTLESAGSVQVKTERFGDTARGDSMFQNYDTNCEEHVRVGFRLPPLFLGRAQDYNFATAMTAYLVTEAQVFLPERKEFDEIMNKTLMKDLEAKSYKFVSLPVTLKNIEIQLKAVELVKDKIDGEHLIQMINDLTGLTMKFSKEAEEQSNKMQFAQAFGEGGPLGQPKVEASQQDKKGLKPGVNPKTPAKSNVVPLKKAEMTPEDVVGLVNDWATAMGLDGGSMEADSREVVLKAVRELTPPQRSLFDKVLAAKAFAHHRDPDGLAEIMGCCADVMV